MFCLDLVGRFDEEGPSIWLVLDLCWIEGAILQWEKGVPIFDEEGPSLDQFYKLLEVRILDDQTCSDDRSGSLPPFGALSEIMHQA
ncbi:hypothetical protein GQ457_04G031590 [Hibiscus cannabinus]